jgi:hypothetical protein
LRVTGFASAAGAAWAAGAWAAVSPDWVVSGAANRTSATAAEISMDYSLVLGGGATDTDGRRKAKPFVDERRVPARIWPEMAANPA